uniref:Uncharacterized protein n=1 Tax=Sphaerodactylus townsendi TaxID=933632 RepID=A0ACB8G0D3_9SAUR
MLSFPCLSPVMQRIGTVVTKFNRNQDFPLNRDLNLWVKSGEPCLRGKGFINRFIITKGVVEQFVPGTRMAGGKHALLWPLTTFNQKLALCLHWPNKIHSFQVVN